MTTNPETPRLVIAGNGTRGPFALSVSGTPITYSAANEWVFKRYTTASVLEGTLVDGVDFDLSVDAVATGDAAGTLTLDASEAVLASGEKIVGERVTAKSSSFALNSTGGIFEAALDKMTRLVQEIWSGLARAVTGHPLYTGALELPYPEAGKFVGWNADADGFVNLDSAATGVGADVAPALVSAADFRELAEPDEARVADQAGATDQAKLAAAAATGLSVRLPPTLAPSAEPTALPSGASLLGGDGGSTITYPVIATSPFLGLRFEGSAGTALTLDANASAQARYIKVTSVAACAIGQVVHIFAPYTSPETAVQFAARIVYIDATNKRLYLSSELPFALTTGAPPTITLETAPYSDAVIDDIVIDGSALTGRDTRGVTLYHAEGLKVGKIRAVGWHGSDPANHSSMARGIDIFRVYDCDFEELSTIRSGGYNGGAITINGAYNCHFGRIVCEDSYDDGPLFSFCDGITVDQLMSLSTRGGNSGRGFKLQWTRGFHIGHAVVDSADSVGAGFLYGSSGSVGLLEINRPHAYPGIVSIVVASNVATIVVDAPILRAVGDVLPAISGCADANLNAAHTITEVVGDPLTTLTYKFAVTTADANPAAGTPVFAVNANPAVWVADGANRVHIDTLVLSGAGLAGGSDIEVYTNSTLHIGTLYADATPIIPAAGGVLTIDKLYINGVLTAHANNTPADKSVRFSAADKMLYGGASGAPTEAALTAAGRALLDDADARAQCATLGTWRVLAQSTVAASHTGNTSETTLATVTIPAGAMGANGRVRITSVYSYTNNANNKTQVIKFGGTNIWANTQTTNLGYRHQSDVGNRNAANSQYVNYNGDFGSFNTAAAALAVDTSADADILFRGTLANSGDTITLESYLVELYYAA